LCAGYHTHAFEWTPDYAAWFVDGVELRRITGADATAFTEHAVDGMDVRFSVWVGNASFGGTLVPNTLPVAQYVNYFSYSEYTPGAGDAGSDFTFSFREDFDELGADWLKASWDSPFALSTHVAENAGVIDGKLVLAVTPDGAGLTGLVPPSDPADLEPEDPNETPASGGSSGAGGSLGEGGAAQPGASNGGAGGAPLTGGMAGGSTTANGGALAAGMPGAEPASTGAELGAGANAAPNPAGDLGTGSDAGASGCHLSRPARSAPWLFVVSLVALFFSQRRRKRRSCCLHPSRRR
jgi:hypothetical protein